MRFIIKLANMVLFVFAAWLLPAMADKQTWRAGTGDWSEVANWSTAVPADGDDVVITNLGAFVRLTNSTARLSSMVVSNGCLSFSNWNTTIYATNLTIDAGGILTCVGSLTNNVISNRVSLNCGALFIGSNGAINVNGKGYPSCSGPGGGAGYNGASYGGAGMYGYNVLRTNTYGSATAPLDPGSGGGNGAASYGGGFGGGAVCITAIQVVVNGMISANASNAFGGYASGGSGGGIYIVCVTIAGTNGSITANAGNAEGGYGGGAGGGRIAVIYDTVAQSAITPVPSIRFSAASSRSCGSVTYLPGDIGTLYFPDNYFFSPTNLFTGQWLAPGTISFSTSDWIVSNVWSRLSAASITVSNTLTVAGTNADIFKLEITNNAVINCGNVRLSGAALMIGYSCNTNASSKSLNLTTSGPTLTCSGDLTLTNASQFYVAAGLTNNGATAGCGARVVVGGNVLVATNCWICPVAHSTNGTAVLFNLGNLSIDAGGGFFADALGYGGGLRVETAAGNPYGSGSVPYNGGAGYGGKGSDGHYYVGGTTYGSSNAPVDAGSGAAAGRHSGSLNGPYGGGSVQILATDTVTVKGAIQASGGAGVDSYGSGASGGSIYITCRTFVGDANGVLKANGGTAKLSGAYTGGGGGGGRIAVWRIFDRSTGVISNYVNGGLGYPVSNPSTGVPGTIVWGWIVPPCGSIISVY